MCGFPHNVPHARHNAEEAPDRQDFAIDSLVEYECFVGYEAKGFSKAKCLYYNGTAQWFGPDLKCIRKLTHSFLPRASSFQVDHFINICHSMAMSNRCTKVEGKKFVRFRFSPSLSSPPLI
jgi:hypothetical protein